MNTRKFRTWDDALLTSIMEEVIQIKTTVEEKCLGSSMLPEEMPPSVIPTHILYDLASASVSMYNKLLAYELVSGGYVKDSKNLH